jgi:hypothetical protein
MEGFSVSSDQWHLVARHLRIVDLCRLMQVSRDWFHLWIADRAWWHHRQRICARFPELNALFELYCDKNASGEHSSKRTKKSNSNKKRKKVWITPKRGVWYIFKKWLMMGTNMKGFKTLLKRKDMHPLAMSVVKICLPFPERITKLYVESSNHYIVWIEWDTNCRFSVETSKTNSFFRMVLHIFDNRFYLQKDYVTREAFSTWKRYLLQTTHCIYGLMFLAGRIRDFFSQKKH